MNKVKFLKNLKGHKIWKSRWTTQNKQKYNNI